MSTRISFYRPTFRFAAPVSMQAVCFALSGAGVPPEAVPRRFLLHWGSRQRFKSGLRQQNDNLEHNFRVHPIEERQLITYCYCAPRKRHRLIVPSPGYCRGGIQQLAFAVPSGSLHSEARAALATSAGANHSIVSEGAGRHWSCLSFSAAAIVSLHVVVLCVGFSQVCVSLCIFSCWDGCD